MRFAVSLLFGAALAAPSVGQTTYTWAGGGTGGAWLSAGNWSGGGDFPGATGNPGLPGGSATDVAYTATAGPTANLAAGIDFSPVGANGQLALAGVWATLPANGRFAVGNTAVGSTNAGTLTLGGTTVGGTANVVLANTGGAGSVLRVGSNGVGDGSTMQVRLASPENTILTRPGTITQLAASVVAGPTPTNLRIAGGGTVDLSASNIITHTVTVESGTLRMLWNGTFLGGTYGGSVIPTGVTVAAGATFMPYGVYTGDGRRVDVAGRLKLAEFVGSPGIGAGGGSAFFLFDYSAGGGGGLVMRTGSRLEATLTIGQVSGGSAQSSPASNCMPRPCSSRASPLAST